MEPVKQFLEATQGIAAIPVAIALIFGIVLAIYKSAVSARLLSHRAESTANRLVRVEKSLADLNGLLAESLAPGAPEVSIPQEATLAREAVPLSLEEQENAFYRARGFTISEAPAKAARRLLSKAIDAAGAELTVEAALDLFRTISDQQNRVDERTNLREVSVQQLNSSASTKTSMIWLFLAFNLAIIFALLFSIEVFVKAKEVVLGLYISMAMFIVFVFRSSNIRALTLLSITEDLKRYHDAEKYIANLGTRAATDRDVEILKLILTNRAEREKGAEHPYELVLKGITNSTVLLKGGKVASTERGPKPK